MGVPFTSDFDSPDDRDTFRFSGDPAKLYSVQATIGDTTALLDGFDVSNDAFELKFFRDVFDNTPVVFPATPDMDLFLEFRGRSVASDLGLPLAPYTYELEVMERPELVLTGGPEDDVLSFDLAEWPATVAMVRGGAGTDTFTPPEVPPGVTIEQGNFLISEPGISSVQFVGSPLTVYFDSIETFQGTGFNDSFRVYGGTDVRIEAGDGNDGVRVWGAGTNRVFDGGAQSQFDSLRYFSEVQGEGVSVSLLDGVGLAGAAAGDTIIGIEWLIGTLFADTLIGGEEDELLDGHSGADILQGNGGDDTLDGGLSSQGEDVAVFNFDIAEYTIAEVTRPDIHLFHQVYEVAHSGSDGTDYLYEIEVFRFADGDFFPGGVTGTAGKDWIVWDTRSFRVDGAAGTDMLSFVDAAGRVEVAAGLGSAFVQVPRNAPERDAFLRLFDIEGITGGRFDDILRGGDGAERLRGLAGDDLFIGSAGADTIEGGSGLDELRYVASDTGVSASLLRGKGWAGDAAGDVFSGIEYLSGSRFDDSLTGSNDTDTLFGGEGDDILMGNGGDDYLNGHTGTDTALFGYARDQYAVTTTGFRTVVDYIGPGPGDGTDTLDHVEILRFADGDVIL